MTVYVNIQSILLLTCACFPFLLKKFSLTFLVLIMNRPCIVASIAIAIFLITFFIIYEVSTYEKWLTQSYIKCKYEENYYCRVEEFPTRREGRQFIRDPFGIHLIDNRNNSRQITEVNRVIFDNITVKLFPRNLENCFVNLQEIFITFCGLKEIKGDDLKPFGEKLLKVFLNDNLIEVIESDLFAYNLNLKTINLADNKIKSIASETFKNLNHLETLNLKNNICISDESEKDQNVTKNLILIIQEKCN